MPYFQPAISVFRSHDDLGYQAAVQICHQIQQKPDTVLGLATGSTPIPVYAHLAAMYQAGKVDFSKVVTFNLDEYYPLSPDHPQSYHTFMRETLFNHVNIRPENIHILRGDTTTPDAECHQFEAAIKRAGGIDLQILGIGVNGHIGFNEPETPFASRTHCALLSEQTRQDNARFFSGDINAVPTKALTMGPATIMGAREIILLANGPNKAPAVDMLLHKPVDPANQATILRTHANTTLLLDQEAYGYNIALRPGLRYHFMPRQLAA